MFHVTTWHTSLVLSSLLQGHDDRSLGAPCPPDGVSANQSDRDWVSTKLNLYFCSPKLSNRYPPSDSNPPASRRCCHNDVYTASTKPGAGFSASLYFCAFKFPPRPRLGGIKRLDGVTSLYMEIIFFVLIRVSENLGSFFTSYVCVVYATRCFKFRRLAMELRSKK